MFDEFIYYWPIIFFGIFFIIVIKDYLQYKKIKEEKYYSTEKENLLDTLVLIRQVGNISDSELKKTSILLRISIIFLPVMLFIPILFFNDLTVFDIVEKVNTNGVEIYAFIGIYLIFVIFYPLYIGSVKKHERLILDAEGIKYTSLNIPFFEHYFPGWEIKWSNVSEIKPSDSVAQGRLAIHPKRGKTRYILLNQWEIPNNNKPKKRNNIFLNIYKQTNWRKPEFLSSTLIVRYIVEKVGIQVPFQTTGISFDLMSDGYTRKATALIFVLLTYAIVDFVANPEIYLKEPSWIIYIIIAGIAAVTSAWVINRGKASTGTSIVFGLFLGVIFGVAAYPGMMRVNQFTDTKGLQNYDYKMGYDGVLKSPHEEIPDVTMKANKYWGSFKTGERYTLRIRKGGLGFYQLDMNDVYRRMRKWHCIENKHDDCDD